MQTSVISFHDRAQAALDDPTLKIAIDRTTGNAEKKRAVAVAAFPQAEAIYQANIATLRRLGLQGWRILGVGPGA